MSHVTRTPLSRSKGQGHQATLLTAVLAHPASAAVGVGTCWPWETAATLPSARWRKALRCPRGRMGGGILWRPPTYSLLFFKTHFFMIVHFPVHRCSYAHLLYDKRVMCDITGTDQLTWCAGCSNHIAYHSAAHQISHLSCTLHIRHW